MFKLLVVLAIVPAIFAQTPVRVCGNGAPLPNAAHLGGREDTCLTPPCPVSRAQGFAVTDVNFTPGSTTSTFRIQVRAFVFGFLWITQEIPSDISSNWCQILTDGHTCPLPGGAPAWYRLQLPVDPSTPQLDPDTEITLFDDNNQIVFCYQVATTIV